MKSCIKNNSAFKSTLKILHVVKQLKEDIDFDDVAQHEKREKKASKIRKFWVRDIFPKREMHSEYYHLLPDLLSGDRVFYFRYLGMNPERFEHLLTLVKGTLNAFDDFKNNKKFVVMFFDI